MISHIRYDARRRELALLDQRRLPGALEWGVCRSYAEVIDAIKTLAVRGAPAIGVAAAWACALAATEAEAKTDWRAFVDAALAQIAAARPTAVNLAWAVARMRKAGAKARAAAELYGIWAAEAGRIQEEDIARCKAIGKAGAELIRDGDVVLTHCNAGALATAGYGTALGVIRAAWEQGKRISVIADETRPLLQGARLTAWELEQDGIPVKVACDNACAALMSRGAVDLVITGADRIAANGDSANKIGTLGAAIIARHFGVPFYIAAPLSTFDAAAATGRDIPIEERAPGEVLELAGQRVAPAGAGAVNYAFDVAPAELIDGIITEKGVLRPPFAPAIATLLAEAGHEGA